MYIYIYIELVHGVKLNQEDVSTTVCWMFIGSLDYYYVVPGWGFILCFGGSVRRLNRYAEPSSWGEMNLNHRIHLVINQRTALVWGHHLVRSRVSSRRAVICFGLEFGDLTGTLKK